MRRLVVIRAAALAVLVSLFALQLEVVHAQAWRSAPTTGAREPSQLHLGHAYDGDSEVLRRTPLAGAGQAAEQVVRVFGRALYAYRRTTTTARTSRALPRALPIKDLPQTRHGRPLGVGDDVLRHYTDDLGLPELRAQERYALTQTVASTSLQPVRRRHAGAGGVNMALGRTPTGYFEVPRARLPGLQGPRRVDPWNGQPGGGVECWVTCSVEAEGLKRSPFAP